MIIIFYNEFVKRKQNEPRNITMNLSISNIGWNAENDEAVYKMMQERGFTGLEIAPTKIIPEKPYDDLERAGSWADSLKKNQGFTVPSMQSIWYGRKEQIFGSAEERHALTEYTKKAIDYAAVIGCGNLVFGCPKNRSIPENPIIDKTDPMAADATGTEKNENIQSFQDIGIQFFKELGDYAAAKGTVIGMEANPSIYGTNYVNRTEEALNLIDEVDSPGFRLNLDVGTMVQNEESVDLLRGKVSLINHVHISEPFLAPIEKRTLHLDLKELLIEENYRGFVSIEMGTVSDLYLIEKALDYTKEIFG